RGRRWSSSSPSGSWSVAATPCWTPRWPTRWARCSRPTRSADSPGGGAGAQHGQRPAEVADGEGDLHRSDRPGRLRLGVDVAEPGGAGDRQGEVEGVGAGPQARYRAGGVVGEAVV